MREFQNNNGASAARFLRHTSHVCIPGVSIGVNVGVPAPVYVAPAPVYAPPPPPVVYAPPPPPVYAQPVYAQPVYAQPAIVIGWHGDRYWDGRRYWDRDDWYRHHPHGNGYGYHHGWH